MPTALPKSRVAIRGPGWNSKRPSTHKISEVFPIKEVTKSSLKVYEDPIIRQPSTSQGIRQTSRHSEALKTRGLELFTPSSLPHVDNHEKSWGSQLNASETTDKSRRGQFNQPDIDERPRTVKGTAKHSAQTLIQAAERPRTRGNMQADHDFAVVSPDQTRKRPVTCKTYQVPLIVTRDNGTKPDVEHTTARS
jgi:hypothetical protein